MRLDNKPPTTSGNSLRYPRKTEAKRKSGAPFKPSVGLSGVVAFYRGEQFPSVLLVLHRRYAPDRNQQTLRERDLACHARGWVFGKELEEQLVQLREERHIGDGDGG